MPVPDFSPGEVLTAAAMDSIGLWKVASGPLSSTATNFVGCFTDDYRNYRIVIDSVEMSGSGDLYFRTLNGSTPFTGASYEWSYLGLTTSSTAANSAAGSQTLAYTGLEIGGATGIVFASLSFDIYGPKLAQRKFVTSQAMGLRSGFYYGRTGMTAVNDTIAYDGIQFLTNTAVTMAGNVTIYGYRK